MTSLDSTLVEGNQIPPTQEWLYWFKENRLETFNDWPFDEPAKCTADSMAEAGFIHMPTDVGPDAVMCFFCRKELDGWEPDDLPWDEHVSHTKGKCDFLKNADRFNEITYEQMLMLEIKRQQNITVATSNSLKQKLKDHAADVRDKLETLLD